MSLLFATKARTLEHLSTRLQHSVVDPVLSFALDEWQLDKDGILSSIEDHFPNQPIIVRSSAVDEDALAASKAGYYHSESNVPSGCRQQLDQAIDRVVNSYSRNGRVPSMLDEVLVQPQVQDVALAGVVFTRDVQLGSPFYVVNYDDRTGRTDAVTSGSSGRVLRLARWRAAETFDRPWDTLLLAVQEVEQVYGDTPLDIEFAIDLAGRVHTFQVRPLAVSTVLPLGDDWAVEAEVKRLNTDLNRTIAGTRLLPGSRTILADMSDWNPAEMLGGRPNVLDRSLYRFLITRSTWNAARVSLGYADVSPCELMVTLANKPYIDAQVSFNSLTPRSIPVPLRTKLIDYYLAKLELHPELQDKIEFEIVFSCFDLSFQTRARDLTEHGMSESDVDLIQDRLLAHTNALLAASPSIMAQDLQALRRLAQRTAVHAEPSHTAPVATQQALKEAYRLLADCRDLGTFTFSRSARLAFVGMALLKSMLDHEVLSQAFFDRFMSNLNTVASGFASDVSALARGTFPLDAFLERYGHLRVGTYNILSPRYDQVPDLFSNLRSSFAPSSPPHSLVEDRAALSRIGSTLNEHGIQHSGEAVLCFAKQALEYREYAKFEFTKALSAAIELIALAGSQLGLSRDELASIDLETLMRFRDSPDSDLQDVRVTWQDVSSNTAQMQTLHRRIPLPPVITSASNLTCSHHYESRPNFVTRKVVQGAVLDLSGLDYHTVPEVMERIVLIENADPGYDWIFSRNPKGLITKYGGVASHMAIRCAELGVSAAIGCGETLFDRLRAAGSIRLDCAIESVAPL